MATNELMKKVDKIIAMDSELLKSIPSKYLSKVEDWEIENLAGKSIEKIRKIRDRIKKRVEQLIKEIN